MKKMFLFLSLTIVVFAMQFCTGSKKAQTAMPSTTYVTHVQPIIASNCTPCHFPPKGRATALDNYAAVKDEIDDIIRRIQLNPGEKGFMPAKHPKLADSTIQVFIRWKESGLAQQ